MHWMVTLEMISSRNSCQVSRTVYGLKFWHDQLTIVQVRRALSLDFILWICDRGKLVCCPIYSYHRLRLSFINQLGQKFSQPQTEDIRYAKTRDMLHNLGLQSYVKNFQRGLLTDNTLPLLTDRLGDIGTWISF